MTNLFVSGLAWHSNEESLNHAFSPFGIIIETTVIRDRDTGRSRGFGFVRFATTEQAQNAIRALDRTMLDERVIGVSFAEGRGAGRGRGTPYQRGGRADFRGNSGSRGGGVPRQYAQPVGASYHTGFEGPFFHRESLGRTRQFLSPYELTAHMELDTNPYREPVAPPQGQVVALQDTNSSGATSGANINQTSQDGNTFSPQYYYPPRDPSRQG